jgi:phage baseplate assembly protein W
VTPATRRFRRALIRAAIVKWEAAVRMADLEAEDAALRELATVAHVIDRATPGE